MIIAMYKFLKKTINIKIKPWRKNYKSAIYYLCRLRVFASKNEHLS